MKHSRYDAVLCGRKQGRRVRFLCSMALGCALIFGALGACAADELSDAGQQQAALHALMGKNHVAPDSVKGIALAPWTHGPTNAGAVWVVAALVQPPGDDNEPQLWTGVLSRDGQGFHLLAGDRSERVEPEPILWNPSIALDLIAYRINDQETAFGVRFDNAYSSTAHSDTQEVLSLYRYAGGALTPIFTALTDRYMYDRSGAEDCAQEKAGTDKQPTEDRQNDCDAANTTEQHYVVSFSRHITHGYYDLLLRPKGRHAASDKSVGAVWNGKGYQPRRFDSGL
ncbi:MAG: hypothetical protein WAM90_16320 [Rhodanobacter sp.]